MVVRNVVSGPVFGSDGLYSTRAKEHYLREFGGRTRHGNEPSRAEHEQLKSLLVLVASCSTREV
jgi:hypothetical protein